MDFNPAADRLRVITADGANLRINVDDGKTTVDGALKYKDGDANGWQDPRRSSPAPIPIRSIRNRPGLRCMTSTRPVISLTQAPPNDGVLNTVGMLGVKIDGPIAFNIVASAATRTTHG